MHDQDSPDQGAPATGTGEFDCLLREIEKEAVPARLLELAQKLQAALAEQRRARDGDNSAET